MEKYRPQRLNDVVGNEDAVQRLRAIAKDGNMPHMILTVSCDARMLVLDHLSICVLAHKVRANAVVCMRL